MSQQLEPHGSLLTCPALPAAAPQKDITMGRKLATGGFGTVYKGELKQADGKKVPVVVKKVRCRLAGMVWQKL